MAEQTNTLARLSQKQSEAAWKKVEKKTMKERQKALEKMQGGRGESDNGPKRSGRLTTGWRNLATKLLK